MRPWEIMPEPGPRVLPMTNTEVRKGRLLVPGGALLTCGEDERGRLLLEEESHVPLGLA